MLDWCRNGGHVDHNSQIIFASSTPTQPLPKLTHPPKFALPPTQLLDPHTNIRERKRYIKTHFDRSFTRYDQQVQTSIARPITVDCATQTHKITLQLPLNERRGTSMACSRETSPLKPNSHISYLYPSSKHSEITPTPLEMSLRRSGDYQIAVKDTKTTNCLLQTKDRVDHSERNRNVGAIGVESYVFPHSTHLTHPSQSVQPLPTYYPQYPTEYNGCESVAEREEPQFQPDSPQRQSTLTFSQKYRQILRNVESQFKLSQKKQSQKKLVSTPDRRLLFHERETIVSKYNHEENLSERSMLIQQSQVFEPEIRSCFTPLTHTQFLGDYSLYLALQKVLGIVVSIKEITFAYMHRISEELLVYKQLETRTDREEGILALYQTQIDRGSYMLVKEPFTSSLRAYLASSGNLSSITLQLQGTLQRMYSRGFILRKLLEIDDLVVCLGQVKIHNAGIFTLDKSCGGHNFYQVLHHFKTQCFSL